jgi:hypothetical protein
MNRTIVALALSAIAAACTTTTDSGQVDAATLTQAAAPLSCSGRAECDLWWHRAQVWVSKNSAYPVQAVTDAIIQTSGPSGGQRSLAYRITKSPNTDGTATVGFEAHCSNMLGCEPNPWEAGANFKQFVRGGPAPLATPAATPAAPPTPDGVEVTPVPGVGFSGSRGAPGASE